MTNATAAALDGRGEVGVSKVMSLFNHDYANQAISRFHFFQSLQ